MDSEQYKLNNSIIYQKSIDIFRLTRRVADFVTNDKDVYTMCVSRKDSDRYANSLVMDSLGLVPKIVEAEIQQNPIVKLKYAKSLIRYIDRLYQNCLLLEDSKIQGKEFVGLLRIELKNLRRIHKSYVNSLL